MGNPRKMTPAGDALVGKYCEPCEQNQEKVVRTTKRPDIDPISSIRFHRSDFSRDGALPAHREEVDAAEQRYDDQQIPEAVLLGNRAKSISDARPGPV